jgi:hypothetical protein
MPGPLADAVLQLITDGRTYRGVGSPATTTWLFPGHLPGRPITPAALGAQQPGHPPPKPDATSRPTHSSPSSNPCDYADLTQLASP